MSLRSLLKNIPSNKRKDFMSIGGLGGDDGASDPERDITPLQPPSTLPPRRIPIDDRIIRDQGLGGYLNPRQISQFVNPPKPDNTAGQQDMANLMQQQQDTFGARFVYPDPVTTPPYTPPPGDGGGTGGGGIVLPPDDGPPIKFPPYDIPGGGGIGGGIGGGQFPPIFPPNFPPINPPIDVPPIDPPFDGPGIPPMVPPQVPPVVPPTINDDRYQEIMDRLKGIEDSYSKGIGGLQNRFDNLPTPVEPPAIDYDFLTKRVQDSLDLPPSIDKDILMKDIMKNIDIPKPPSIDRDALIDEIRSGITMPDLSGYATIDDLNKGIGGINIPSYDDSEIRDLINKKTGAIGSIPSYDD